MAYLTCTAQQSCERSTLLDLPIFTCSPILSLHFFVEDFIRWFLFGWNRSSPWGWPSSSFMYYRQLHLLLFTFIFNHEVLVIRHYTVLCHFNLTRNEQALLLCERRICSVCMYKCFHKLIGEPVWIFEIKASINQVEINLPCMRQTSTFIKKRRVKTIK